MEKIGIKYRIGNLVFDTPPLTNQLYTLSYRRSDEEEYTVFEGDYEVDTYGNNVNRVFLEGLDEDTDYVIRLTNQSDGSYFERPVHTALNIANGDSPIYLKKLFPGQSLNWYVSGLLSLQIPTNTLGWFFDLSGKFADAYEGFGPMEAPDGKHWAMRASYDNAEEAYNCFYMGDGRTLRFCTEHDNGDARIFGDQFIDGSVFYGKFYLDEGASFPVILYVAGKNISTLVTDVFMIGIDSVTLLPYASLNDTVDQFSAPLQSLKWYTLEYRPGTGASVYDGNGVLVSSVVFSFVSNPFASFGAYTNVPIYLGMPDGSTQGVSFCKMYFDHHNSASVLDISKVIKAYRYIATFVFERNPGGNSDEGTVFTPGTYVRIGDRTVSLYTASLDRKPFDVAVTCDVSGTDSDNPITMCVNSYLYQYSDSTTFQKRTGLSGLSDGDMQRLVFVVDNDFAYAARFDLDVILETGTTSRAVTVKITGIEVNGISVSLSDIFKADGHLLTSDSNNGEALSVISITDSDGGNSAVVSIPALSSGGTALETFVTPLKWVSRITDSDIMCTIAPDTPVGMWRMACMADLSDRMAEMDIEVVSVQDRLSESFDIDFGTDFDAALSDFKSHFSGYHSQWGGYNGGCNSNLIYADRDGKTLVFEQHGDNYAGVVDGVAKPAKDSSFNGYGTVAYHTASNDPRLGQVRRTRVGSVATSNKYFGYGEMSVWVRIPEGTYGVCMALWFFHYIEVYPNDERWDYWIGRGGKPYGGADPYMVINNEIDMELPSHDVNGVFASWDELALAYFDPLALDTQFKVGVEGEGTYQLNDVANPNLKASWTKVSDEIMQRNFPYFKACKFNNWVGEKSSGNGWAYTEADYEGEEYLALLTDLSKDFADGLVHQYTFKWYKDHTELWIDGVYVRSNRAFVPFNVARFTIGGWFPSPTEEKYTPDKPGTWAGENADFDVLHFEISRIKYTTYSETEAGGVPEFHSESYPEAGLRELL